MRIVSLLASATEFVCALGAGDRPPRDMLAKVPHVLAEQWVPGDYVSGTILSPETTSCGGNDQEVHYGKTYTKLYCVFANELPAGTQASGTMSVTPDPAPGAGGYLYGFEGYDQAQESGPFTMTGP